MAKKQLYISLPMSGRMDTVQERIDAAREYVKQYYPEYLINNPLNIAEDVDEWKGFTRPFSQSTGKYLGADIEFIVDEADAILLCPGWEKSKGCRVEKAAAEAYGKEILYMEQQQDTPGNSIYNVGDVVRYGGETAYLSEAKTVVGRDVFSAEVVGIDRLHRLTDVADEDITRLATEEEIEAFNQRLHSLSEGYRKHYSRSKHCIVDWYETYDRVIVKEPAYEKYMVDMFLKFNKRAQFFDCLSLCYFECFPFNEENREKYGL